MPEKQIALTKKQTVQKHAVGRPALLQLQLVGQGEAKPYVRLTLMAGEWSGDAFVVSQKLVDQKNIEDLPAAVKTKQKAYLDALLGVFSDGEALAGTVGDGPQ